MGTTSTTPKGKGSSRPDVDGVIGEVESAQRADHERGGRRELSESEGCVLADPLGWAVAVG